MHQLLSVMVERGSSDLHITSEWDVWAVPKKTYADEGVFVI
jgi:hypothetical protein